MTITCNEITYQDQHVTLKGFIAIPESTGSNMPAVMVAHDWTGRNEFACEKARELAKLGYIGFALDMYGDGKLGNTNEEKMALMQPFMQDRRQLQQRILAALNAVKAIPQVDANKIAAIGFCFGGLCVLDLARSGANVAGVISFHGLLNAPEFATKQIHAKILALHGYDDPMVTHEQIITFGDEMTQANANWELNMYGKTMHAFMNPVANDPGFGTVYQPNTAKRAWLAMKNFLNEVFN